MCFCAQKETRTHTLASMLATHALIYCSSPQISSRICWLRWGLFPCGSAGRGGDARGTRIGCESSWYGRKLKFNKNWIHTHTHTDTHTHTYTHMHTHPRTHTHIPAFTLVDFHFRAHVFTWPFSCLLVLLFSCLGHYWSAGSGLLEHMVGTYALRRRYGQDSVCAYSLLITRTYDCLWFFGGFLWFHALTYFSVTCRWGKMIAHMISTWQTWKQSHTAHTRSHMRAPRRHDQLSHTWLLMHIITNKWSYYSVYIIHFLFLTFF